MALDVTNTFVRPGDFTTDQSNGQDFKAVRIDQELDEIATAITTVAQRVDSITNTPTVTIATVTGLQAALDAKQTALGFTPVNSSAVGVSVAPLDANTGKIDSRYLPSSTTSPTAGVTAFNSRTGNVALDASDVTSALGFAPVSEDHSHDINDVTGLQTALSGKQAVLGFTPANASHTHTISDVTGLQAILDAMVAVSTTTVDTETTFPIGHHVIALVPGAPVITKNQLKTIYTGTAGGDVYTVTASGSILTGQWRSRGIISTSHGLFQRVA